MVLPLSGVRVLELAQFLSGPFATMLLGDMGADIIKIESPSGDPQRGTLATDTGRGESSAYVAVNRNKRGMSLDLSHPDGRSLFYDLVAQSDVVVENYRPGVTTRLGIDYPTLQRINPELVYASITGFGADGPLSDRPGLDLVAQGMSGLMSVTGHPGMPPAKVPNPVTDLTAGMYCAIGVLTAYVHRLRTGEGQAVTTSLFEAGLSLGLWDAMAYWTTGEIAGPAGSAHRLAAPYQAMATADGYITVGAGTQKHYELFCQTIGRPELITDERFASSPDRVRNREELIRELELTLVTAPTGVWVEKLNDARIPAGALLNYAEVLEHPHTEARQMIARVPNLHGGDDRVLGTPFKLSGVPNPARNPAPTIAQHTDEVLAEFGIDADRVDKLRVQGVI